MNNILYATSTMYKNGIIVAARRRRQLQPNEPGIRKRLFMNRRPTSLDHKRFLSSKSSSLSSSSGSTKGKPMYVVLRNTIGGTLLFVGGGTIGTITYLWYLKTKNQQQEVEVEVDGNNDSDDSIIPSNIQRMKTIKNNNSNTSLLIPTLEASVRIARLVKAVTLIVADYKLYEWGITMPTVSSLMPSFGFSSSNDSNLNAEQQFLLEYETKQKELEMKLENCQMELEKAQEIYSSSKTTTAKTDIAITTDTNADHNDNYHPKALMERVDARKNEKMNMISAAEELARCEVEMEQLWEHYSSILNNDDAATSENTNDNHNDPKQKQPSKIIINKKKRYSNPKSILHTKCANRLLQLCHTNQGVYIKIGQHLANYDYILPYEYITVLQTLYNDNPIMDAKDVRNVIKEDLGYYPEEIFDQFDPSKPIASASLAQVHVAYLKQQNNNVLSTTTTKSANVDIQRNCDTSDTTIVDNNNKKDHQQQKQPLDGEEIRTKLAIKVQHRGLRETSAGDIYSLILVVRAIEYLFPKDFKLGWIVDEIAPNLPKELNFYNEGMNSKIAAQNLRKCNLSDSCVVPKVLWDYTSPRVLTMEFEEGFKATDIPRIQESNLNPHDIAKLISSVFASQVYLSGFVHCDPHPANVLVREHPVHKGKPQIVLIDHGLYRKLDDTFRIHYSMLWKNIMLANVHGIRESCINLGLNDKSYALFTAVLMARPFDEIIERSKTIQNTNLLGLQSKASTSSPTTTCTKETRAIKKEDVDQIIMRAYAQKFLPQIIALLDNVPRPMILLFKMNDCIRHIHHSLGLTKNTKNNNTSANAKTILLLLTNGKYASKALYEENKKQIQKQDENQDFDNEQQQQEQTHAIKKRSSFFMTSRHCRTILSHFMNWFEYTQVIVRIHLYELSVWFYERKLIQM